ncbi:MAG: chemotaxis protein CheC [Myxococcota bacterium]
MTATPLTERQEDALREFANMGSAKAASMLARLVGDVGVLVDVPVVLAANRYQLGWLLGGRDVKVHASLFGIEGELRGSLWWVLRDADAQRLGQRLLARPGVSGPLSSSSSAALAEAANIVASACLSAMGTLVHANLLPTTPEVRETTVKALVGDGERDDVQTVLAAGFTSTNAPGFAGLLVVMLDGDTTAAALERLGV